MLLDDDPDGSGTSCKIDPQEIVPRAPAPEVHLELVDTTRPGPFHDPPSRGIKDAEAGVLRRGLIRNDPEQTIARVRISDQPCPISFLLMDPER